MMNELYDLRTNNADTTQQKENQQINDFLGLDDGVPIQKQEQPAEAPSFIKLEDQTPYNEEMLVELSQKIQLLD